MTREEKILSMQAPSTRAALSQSNIERVEHRLKPIPKESQCLKEDGSVDLNIRAISDEEFYVHDTFRRRRGKIIEEMRPPQYKVFVNPTTEVRERAIRAFMGGLTVKAIGEKFKDMMQAMFKPDHAHIVAKHMNKVKDEK